MTPRTATTGHVVTLFLAVAAGWVVGRKNQMITPLPGPETADISSASLLANPKVAAASLERAFDPAPVIPLSSQPPAHLIVDSPLPEQLARGYVVVRYRTENLKILPVFGPAALGVLPRIGHLHITVDDLLWHWLDASGEPISINGLPPGTHKLLIELEDPTHKLIERRIVHFEIPQVPPTKENR